MHYPIASCLLLPPILFFFFFNDTATTEIYTLSLHDALPISTPTRHTRRVTWSYRQQITMWTPWSPHSTSTASRADRKSTRLNSSHLVISYAVFCLKKKKKAYTYLHFSYDSMRAIVCASCSNG